MIDRRSIGHDTHAHRRLACIGLTACRSRAFTVHMRYEDILATVGRTPVVRLNKVGDTLAGGLWVKLESFNPGGSVKDRPALEMIEDAERRGVLTPDMTIVEPTSGNTGIGLAMVAAVKGYRAVFVMAEDMSEERKRILAAYGAEIVLTPADKGTVGAIEEARRLEKEEGWFFVGQHYNPANPASHRRTADEIFDDFGADLDVLVCTTGTGGTISGLSVHLRDRVPGLRIVATEPADSPILSKGIACKHKIMGTAPGFIPGTSTPGATTRSCRSPPRPPTARPAFSPRRKASSPASPAGRRWPGCSRSPGARSRGTRSCLRSSRTPANAISAPISGAERRGGLRGRPGRPDRLRDRDAEAEPAKGGHGRGGRDVRSASRPASSVARGAGSARHGPPHRRRSAWRPEGHRRGSSTH